MYQKKKLPFVSLPNATHWPILDFFRGTAKLVEL
jgi:hypothetical protein